MLVPSIFEDHFLDDFFDFPDHRHFPGPGDRPAPMMQTDIEEKDDSYLLTMNIPGYSKDDVKAELNDGNLTITATKNSSNDEKDDKGRYIRRERYFGSCTRSFYVGDNIHQDEIKAKFEDGTLKLTIPKKDRAKEVEENHYIAIEG
ncbi:MAG: Hsp20/alpha crystallin family protein [Clostridiales bacterium]|nr:Hsp20/alpha crystallin family protein [Clostridiales bacterium]